MDPVALPGVQMTRDQFISGYIRSNEVLLMRTHDGVRMDGRRYVALPCNCGDVLCSGWSMVKDELALINLHRLMYSPVPSPWAWFRAKIAGWFR